MKITRRKFAFGAAAAIAMPSLIIPRSSARAADFTFNIGMSMAQSHIVVQQLLTCSKRIAEQSNGRFDLRVYPASQMGGDADMMTQVHSGALHFQLVGGSMLNTIVPVAGINAVGFAFKNYDQIWAAMDGEVGKMVRQALDDKGFFVYGLQYENGYRHLTTSTVRSRMWET